MKNIIKHSLLALGALLTTGCQTGTSLPERHETVVQIMLKTGTEPHANTDSLGVFVVLGDDKKERFKLDNPSVNDFEKGKTDSFTFTVEKDINSIKKIELEVKGTDAWFAESMTVRLFSYDQKKQLQHKFDINRWFSSEQKDIDNSNAVVTMLFDIE